MESEKMQQDDFVCTLSKEECYQRLAAAEYDLRIMAAKEALTNAKRTTSSI